MFFKKYLNLFLKITLTLISLNINFLNLFALASYNSEKSEDKLDFNKKKLIKSPYLIDTGDGFFIEFLGLEIFLENIM